METVLTTKEVAEMLRMNRKVIERWCRWGRLQAFQLQGRGSGWRIPASAIRAIQKGGVGYGNHQAFAAAD